MIQTQQQIRINDRIKISKRGLLKYCGRYAYDMSRKVYSVKEIRVSSLLGEIITTHTGKTFYKEDVERVSNTTPIYE